MVYDNVQLEKAALDAEVKTMEEWWRCPRWAHTKRVYTAEEICTKKGNLKIHYPSNDLSKKLWGILEDRWKVCGGPVRPVILQAKRQNAQNKDVSLTFGCMDPVMVTQMAKYLDTIYVSGWQSSATASSTNEPSPDLADYPMVNSRWSSRGPHCLC